MRDRHGSPPAGAPHASFPFFLLLNPRPSSPRPVPASLRVPWAADGIAPRRDRTTPARLPRPRAWTPPAPGARGTEPEGCVGGSAPPAAASHPWTGGAGCGPCTTRSSPGVRGRLAGGNVPARHGVGAGRCRRRVPMRASRRGSRGAAEAHASGARLAGPEGVEGGGGGRACATGGPGVAYRPGSPDRAGGRRQVNWEPCPARHEPEGGM